MTTGQPSVESASADDAVCEAFVEALAARDTDRLRATVAPDVRLRALVPSGYRESVGADAVLGRMQSWFAEPETIDIQAKQVLHVADRLRVHYRFSEGYGEGDSEIIEQDAYCEVSEGRIQAIDLLCSGHLPEPQAPSRGVHHFDAGELGCGSGLPEEFRRQIAAIPLGTTLEIVARDPAAKEDLPSMARLLGHRVISVQSAADGTTVVAVQRER
jgi:TusA-related sulfurtransferase